VLGEDEHAGVREVAPDLLCGTQPSSVWLGGIRMSVTTTSGA
jgi:hypothetical protein